MDTAGTGFGPDNRPVEATGGDAVTVLLADLRARVDALEAENRTLRGTTQRPAAAEHLAEPADVDGPRVSRRGLLTGAAGVAALGAVGLVASATPAAANSDGGSFTLGDTTNTATHSTTVTASLGNNPALAGINPTSSGIGVLGRSNLSSGLACFGAGVLGDSNVYPGVFGNSGTAYGVVGVTGGQSGNASVTAGVAGDSAKLPGVAGSSHDDAGVYGTSTSGCGVRGFLGTSSFGGVAGVLGEGSTAYGTAGFSNSKAGVRAASVSAEGIKATSSTSVGGSFMGGRAAINLVPTAASGRPTTGAHTMGDVVVDHVGALYLCTASGTPGTWVKVSVTPA